MEVDLPLDGRRARTWLPCSERHPREFGIASLTSYPPLQGLGDDDPDKIRNRESLLLPFATILETGNHVGQVADGRQRRTAAEKFIQWLEDAVDGKAPLVPMRLVELEGVRSWIGEFPDWASRGSGLGDFTIVKARDRQCLLHRARRV